MDVLVSQLSCVSDSVCKVLAVIVLLSCSVVSANNLVMEAELLDSMGNPKLRLVLRNFSTKRHEIYNADLPWKRRQAMLLIAVREGGNAPRMLERATSFLGLHTKRSAPDRNNPAFVGLFYGSVGVGDVMSPSYDSNFTYPVMFLGA